MFKCSNLKIVGLCWRESEQTKRKKLTPNTNRHKEAVMQKKSSRSIRFLKSRSILEMAVNYISPVKGWTNLAWRTLASPCFSTSARIGQRGNELAHMTNT